MKQGLFAAIIGSIILTTQVVAAEDKSALSSARELAKQGLVDYDAGRYSAAAEKLGKAYQVVHVPTLAVHQARTLVKMGKWVAASELYLEAMNIRADKTWQSIQVDAQRDAERERAELLRRIPRLTIALDGAAVQDVKITIDDTEVPAALVGVEQLLDPGARIIKAHRGTDISKETVDLREGVHSTVTLRFNPHAAMPTLPGSTLEVPRQLEPVVSQTELPTKVAEPPHHPSARRTIGWIGLGVGGAGLLTFGITGLLATSKRSSLRDTGSCSEDLRHCPAELQGQVSAYNSLRTVSAIALYGGGALAAAGVTLILTAPKQESKANVAVWLGANSAGLMGDF